jgi:hypothetical protein
MVSEKPKRFGDKSLAAGVFHGEPATGRKS